MKKAPIPENESERLEALRCYNILDTEPESEFDDFTRLASMVCETPIALISIIDEARQWFKSKTGITASESAREISFCAHAIHHDEVFVVGDALEDERFKDNPFVTSEPHIRFYAGAPLITPDGYAIGTLCVIDPEPRTPSEKQIEALKILSRKVIAQLELKRSLAEKEKSHQRYTTIVNHLPQGAAHLYNDKLELIYSGGQEMKALGFNPEAWYGKHISQVLPPKAAEIVEASLKEAQKGSPSTCEVYFRGRNYSVHCTPLPSNNGGPSEILMLTTNITHLKEIEKKLRERAEKLSRVNADLSRVTRLKDEFLASMSHELRTPLNAILGLSEAMQEDVYGPVNERQSKSLKTIENSGKHLLELINDLLDVSKISAGKLTLQIGPVTASKVCESALQLIRPAAQKKRLIINSKIDPAIDTVSLDEKRFRQILLNLLSNAVKFTPEGGEIGLVMKGDKEDETIHITVWDTGIGIEKELQEKLFKPFIQLDSKLSRQYTGSGLGLVLIKGMTELHGGRVELESEAGKGSRFTVSLPWIETHPKKERPLATLPNLKLKRALVIEDSPVAADLFKRYLDEMRAETVSLPEGREAVDMAKEFHPEVVILDVILPDISGWEVMERLRADPATRDIPIIIATVVDDLSRGEDLRADGYMVKPVSRDQFRSTLTEALQNAHREAIQGNP